MDDQFFNEVGSTVVASDPVEWNQSQPASTQPSDFDFIVPQTIESTNLGGSASSAFNNNLSQSDHFQQNEQNRLQRQRQDQINLQLRDKSQREYELKQERRQKGRAQLQAFMAKKDAERVARKEQNIADQEKMKEQLAKLNQEAGWKKVSANVDLKQGAIANRRDMNRMREAILHKYQDELQATH